jgi:hypothetical protein
MGSKVDKSGQDDEGHRDDDDRQEQRCLDQG